MTQADPDLVELGQHCWAIYTTDILGDPFHVLWASRFCERPGRAIQAANVVRQAHGLPLVTIGGGA